jgi:flagellar protein FliO/FliZ
VTPRSILPALLLTAAPPLHAAESAPGLADSLGQTLFGLAIVIGLLLASLWLIKRLSAPRGAAAGLKVLGAVPVGPRERVVLVEIAGQVLVLGVTASSVRTLHVVGAAELGELASAAPPAKLPGDFSAWLKRAMERRDDAR